MTEPIDLVAFADAFVAAKRPLLDHIFPSASIAIACWLSDLQSAAAAGDAARVDRLATRINDMLSDEMTWAQYHHHHCSCMDADHA
jgi:hypothetical protein